MLFAAAGVAVLLGGLGIWYLVSGGVPDPFRPSVGTEETLRYTVRDASGVRACGNREAVLKTVGMTPEEIKSWADDPAGAAERRAVGYDLVKVGHQGQVTIRNARGSISSQDPESASRASSMEDRQKVEWVKDESATGERRSAVFYGSGFTEIIWRGSSGKVCYTFRNANQFCTSSDETSALKTLEMSDDQVRAWVEDRRGARERRSASFSRNGFMEMISWGTMEEPPGLWR
jgi:hypothetical protein